MDNCRTDAYHLSSASCTVSLTVLVVLSMLSLPCGASMTSGPVDVASDCLELSEWSLDPTDVLTSSWKECSLGFR
jgi:hypothetical protein